MLGRNTTTVIMAGMRELERMMDQGKTPKELFTVKTVEVPDPSGYRPRQIQDLRASLGVSQAVFARLLNVAKVTAISWERGRRKPTGAALRLLDLARKEPKILQQS